MKVAIVDEEDNIIEHKRAKDRKPNEIIRVAALWIRNEKNEILIARRSKQEQHFPNLWGPSVTGGVEEGETYEDNVRKEAEEELGLILNNLVLGPKKRLSLRHEFFGQWFLAKASSETQFTLKEGEVDEVKWMSISDLQNWHSKEPESFLPLFIDDLETLKDYENQS